MQRVSAFPKYIIWVYALISIFFVNVIIVPSRFSDYDTYLYITDQLYYFENIEYFRFEIFSNIILLSARVLTQNSILSVDLVHYVIGIFVVAFFVWASRQEEISWKGMLILFSVFGPLLSFVTLRATPAYLICAVAVIFCVRKGYLSFALFACALMFHVSAILVMGPLTLAFLQNHSNRFRFLNASPVAILLLIGCISLTYFTISSYFSSILQSVLSSIPFLSKYLTYVANDAGDSVATTGTVGTSLFHRIYAIGAISFALICVTSKNDNMIRLRGYTIGSLSIFVLLQISPVTAFRQSLFWMIPLILVFPWNRYFIPEKLNVPFVLGCGVAFFYSLKSIYT